METSTLNLWSKPYSPVLPCSILPEERSESKFVVGIVVIMALGIENEVNVFHPRLRATVCLASLDVVSISFSFLS